MSGDSGGGEWLTVEEVAALLKISKETVRQWVRGGELPVLDLGGPRGGYRIRQSDLGRFIQPRYGPVSKLAA